MKLNPNSWYARWYMHIYDSSLPNNFCPFFWSFLMTLLILPFMWPASFFKGMSLSARCGASLVMYIGGLALFGYITAWIGNPSGTGIGTAIIVGIIGIGILIGWLINRRKERKYALRRSANAQYDIHGNWIDPDPNIFLLFKRAIIAWYEKKCPRIEWQYKKIDGTEEYH